MFDSELTYWKSTANSLVDGFDAVIRYLGGYVCSKIPIVKDLTN
jgi:hypothetical protein